MKRFISILLLFLYFAFTLGLVINKHYCSGKLISISFSNAKNKSCSICGTKKMNKNCCKDTQMQLSNDDNQISWQTNFNLTGIYFNALVPFSCFLSVTSVYPNSIDHTGQYYSLETGPPKTPIYITLQSLII
jgi:hypothetical protein